MGKVRKKVKKMSTTLTSLQDNLQLLSQQYQSLRLELSTAVDARQKLDAQLQENEAVKKASLVGSGRGVVLIIGTLNDMNERAVNERTVNGSIG